LGITLPLYGLGVKNTLAQGTRRKAQGDLGHMPSASLGHYAPLSLVVRGRGQEAAPRQSSGQARRGTEGRGKKLE
jgi:hypothetical protein